MHEFSGTFRGGPATFRVTAVKGHVYNLVFTPEWWAAPCARCLPCCADSPLLSERPALTRSARVALLTTTHPSHRLLPVRRAQGGVGC